MMKWEKMEEGYSMPVKSWCENCEEGAVQQAANLAKHPELFHHVALMPDAHQGYGMRSNLWPSKLDRMNLGTLGGGNHFIELQVLLVGHIVADRVLCVP